MIFCFRYGIGDGELQDSFRESLTLRFVIEFHNNYLLQKNDQCSLNESLKCQVVAAPFAFKNEILIRIAIQKAIYQNLFYMASLFFFFLYFSLFLFFLLLKSLMILPNYFLFFRDFPLLSDTPRPTLVKITLNSLSK